MNRLERRKLASLARKSGNKDLEEKLHLYSKLPQECRMCESLFDKDNVKMLSEWMVVVRKREDSMNLYCPPCWKKAKQIASQMQEDKNKN